MHDRDTAASPPVDVAAAFAVGKGKGKMVRVRDLFAHRVWRDVKTLRILRLCDGDGDGATLYSLAHLACRTV